MFILLYLKTTYSFGTLLTKLGTFETEGEKEKKTMSIMLNNRRGKRIGDNIQKG